MRGCRADGATCAGLLSLPACLPPALLLSHQCRFIRRGAVRSPHAAGTTASRRHQHGRTTGQQARHASSSSQQCRSSPPACRRCISTAQTAAQEDSTVADSRSGRPDKHLHQRRSPHSITSGEHSKEWSCLAVCWLCLWRAWCSPSEHTGARLLLACGRYRGFYTQHAPRGLVDHEGRPWRSPIHLQREGAVLHVLRPENHERRSTPTPNSSTTCFPSQRPQAPMVT